VGARLAGLEIGGAPIRARFAIYAECARRHDGVVGGKFDLSVDDWLESPELRRRCHAGLNKSEQRHFLAQEICTFNQGRIAERGAEAQQFRASGLNLVIAAIVYWNSTYIADAVAHLRAQESLDDALLVHTTPLTWEHIGFSGDFLWERAAAAASKRRPLNLRRVREAA
jgi:Tn3 transposase DDE domain